MGLVRRVVPYGRCQIVRLDLAGDGGIVPVIRNRQRRSLVVNKCSGIQCEHIIGIVGCNIDIERIRLILDHACAWHAAAVHQCP